MNPLLRVLATASLILLICSVAFAQQDSVSISYDEEPAESSNFSLKEKYKYFTRSNVEETSMLKAGLSNIGFASYAGLFMEHTFAYEKKINVPFSVLAQYRQGMSGWRSSHVGVDAAVRYYYSLPRRIRQGKSANNLSANYFSVQIDNTWQGLSRFVSQGQFTFLETKTYRTSNISLRYGIQRRLGKHGYVDFNLGGVYPLNRGWAGTRPPFHVDINYSIGFAF